MGLLDALFGRSKPVKPDLDALFAIPDVAITLETAAGFKPTGTGSVCFRAAEGGPFERIKDDITALLGGARPEEVHDSFGYTWLVVHHDASDVPALVTDLHAVNSTLEAEGFGPSLLCSLVGFRDDDGRRLGLVYLYKQGSFYPFAPVGVDEQRRDNALEMQIRGVIAGDLRVEEDLNRWFPVWGAPGL